jgi:hypothetical protein
MRKRRANFATQFQKNPPGSSGGINGIPIRRSITGAAGVN